MSKFRYISAPSDLSSKLRGLYGQVARQLGVDPSYISQVARGEIQSTLVEEALRCELAKIIAPESKTLSKHEVQFYSDDMLLFDRLVPFVASALKMGDPVIIVATESHRDGLFLRLTSQGLDVDAATKAGMYVALDAVSTLATFMANDMPDWTRFLNVVTALLEKAAGTGKTARRRVAVFGELVSLLWNEGKPDAAIQLERVWNQLAATYNLDILCGYKMPRTYDEVDEHDFKSVCAEHTGIYS